MEQQKVFFSYARADAAEFALKIANELKEAGANIWIDQLNIQGGEKYNIAIEKALEASTHVLFIVSEKSIVSDYVMDEVYYAVDEGKVVIPVVVHECKLPLRLRGLQKINFTTNHEKGVCDLFKTLNLNPPFNQRREVPALFLQDAVDVYNRGLQHYHNGNYSEAITDFTKAIEIHPQYAEAYGNRGVSYKAMGNFECAITDYTKAIELNPYNKTDYYNRGTLYYKINKNTEAIADFTKTIELDPYFAWAYQNRGLVYGRIEDYHQAIADFTKAIELDTRYALAYFNRAHAKEFSDDKDGACHDFKKSCELGYKDGCSNYDRLIKKTNWFKF